MLLAALTVLLLCACTAQEEEDYYYLPDWDPRNTTAVTESAAVTTLAPDTEPVSTEPLPAGTLPAYLQAEVDDIVARVKAAAGKDSVVFGFFTDLHYPYNSYTVTQKDNTCYALRAIAQAGVLDFTLDGGDLYDGSSKVNSYENDRAVSFHVAEIFTESPVPHFTQSGDHDRNQSHDNEGEKQIMSHSRAADLMPYLEKYGIVRPKDAEMARSLYFYYDLPAVGGGLNTRYVNIANAANEKEVASVYKWLKEEVFTDEVKNGWQFIVSCHIPVDVDSLAGYAHAGGSAPSRLNWNYHRLFDALNAAEPFEYDYAASQTVYYGADNRVTADAKAGTPFILEKMSDRPATDANPGEYGEIDFTGWTSKVRLVVSGHNHCDRFGYRAGGEWKTYVTAYTTSAATSRPDTTKTDEWYVRRFGGERTDFTKEVPGDGLVWWTETKDSRRVDDTADEMAFDVYIVNPDEIVRLRFGCGRDMAVGPAPVK